MRCINDFDVGLRLKELRLKHHMKMIDIAVELEISMAQYSRLENEVGRISTDVLSKAHKYYRCSMDYILWGDETAYESVFFQKISKFEEKDKRRFLKILCCLLDAKEDTKEQADDPMYKIFMDGLLERIPAHANSSMMYILEYEKNRLNISENAMIDRLGLSRFKWSSIMNGKKVSDIMIPLEIKNQFGYDMEFLIDNRITENIFFDQLFYKYSKKKQNKIMQLFDIMIKAEGEELQIEVQLKR